MEYMLMIYVNEAGWPKLSKAEQERGMAAYFAYSEALQKAGVFKAGSQLGPSSAAKTIRTSAGKYQVLDGPYADAKEQLGGYYLINANDLDEAIKIAERIPVARFGTIEIRPVMQITGLPNHEH